jgi:hypothetical protein
VAYDFGGTFNNHQFARAAAFAQNQQVDVPGRITHLAAEIQRIGTIVFQYDAGGNPTGYSADPPTSYIGKLVMAYEVLGGDALFDLQIRSMSQSVFVVAGTNTTPSQQLSSGDIIGMPGQMDALSSNLIQQMRAWTPEAIQYKRENIERKVRRAMDYADQLNAEIQTLTIILNSSATSGSLADTVSQVMTLLADPTYRATNTDTSGDIHGKRSRAPFSQWDAGPNRGPLLPVTTRMDGGVSIGGEQVPQGDTPPTGGTGGTGP